MKTKKPKKALESPKLTELLKLDAWSTLEGFKIEPQAFENLLILNKIIFTCSRFKEIIKDNPDKNIDFIIKRDSALKKLNAFLNENADVSKLLNEFIIQDRNKIIFDKVERGELYLTLIAGKEKAKIIEGTF